MSSLGDSRHAEDRSPRDSLPLVELLVGAVSGAASTLDGTGLREIFQIGLLVTSGAALTALLERRKAGRQWMWRGITALVATLILIAVTVIWPVEPLTVLDVRGQDRQVACQILQSSGFDCAQVASRAPNPRAFGEVWDQDPAPNSRRERGSTVTITYEDLAPVPLYLLRGLSRDGTIMRLWYITTDSNEVAQLTALPANGDAPKYQPDGADGQIGRCYPSPAPGAVPVWSWHYEFGDGRHQQHLFTIEENGGAQPEPWVKESKPVCWVYPRMVNGSRPLFRMAENPERPGGGGIVGDGNAHLFTFEHTQFQQFGFFVDQTWYVRPQPSLMSKIASIISTACTAAPRPFSSLQAFLGALL